MQDKQTKQDSAQAISNEQASEVAGGDGACTSTVTIGSTTTVTTSAPTPGDALIATYEGIVDATSYVIERVANSVK